MPFTSMLFTMVVSGCVLVTSSAPVFASVSSPSSSSSSSSAAFTWSSFGSGTDTISTFACSVTATPGLCGAAERCANESVVKGVKNRGDAADCCCSSNSTMLWTDPKAKCREAKKCTWECCKGGTKLCGKMCCDSGSKCQSGVCSQAPTTTSAPPTPTTGLPPAATPMSWWTWLIVGVGLLAATGGLCLWLRTCCQRHPEYRHTFVRARDGTRRRLANVVPQNHSRDLHVRLEDRRHDGNGNGDRDFA